MYFNVTEVFSALITQKSDVSWPALNSWITDNFLVKILKNDFQSDKKIPFKLTYFQVLILLFLHFWLNIKISEGYILLCKGTWWRP